MQRALLLLLLTLSVPTCPVYAEPIVTITSGSLVVVNNVGTLTFRATHGVEVDLRGEALGHFGTQCVPCAPGDILDLGGALEDAAGSVTLGDLAVPPHIQIDVNAFRFESTGTVPPLNSDGILSVPFDFPGQLFVFNPFPEEGEPTLIFPVVGHGTATVEFVRNPSVPLWEFKASRFDFASTATPEPATLVLIGGGLAGLIRRSRRVRRA
jgi:hypothetical protein